MKWIISILALFFWTCPKAQYLDKSCEKIDYRLKDDNITIIRYTLKNTYNENLLIWYDSKNTTVSKKIIKDFFLKTKGDTNLYQIFFEANISCVDTDAMLNFIKLLTPQETFTMYFYTNNEEFVNNYVDHLLFAPETYIDQVLPNFSNRLNNVLLYKNDFIFFPCDYLN